MKKKQVINYMLIIIGIVVAMYAKVDSNQNKYILIVGICFLMFGVFRLSQTIPSKKDKDNHLKDREHDDV